MNQDTGRLRELAKEECLKDREILIDAEILTKKQKKEKKVSLKDHKSKAGIILTKARWNDLSKNQQRNTRKRLNK